MFKDASYSWSKAVYIFVKALDILVLLSSCWTLRKKKYVLCIELKIKSEYKLQYYK